jgi:hypothetical protein
MPCRSESPQSRCLRPSPANQCPTRNHPSPGPQELILERGHHSRLRPKHPTPGGSGQPEPLPTASSPIGPGETSSGRPGLVREVRHERADRDGAVRRPSLSREVNLRRGSEPAGTREVADHPGDPRRAGLGRQPVGRYGGSRRVGVGAVRDACRRVGGRARFGGVGGANGALCGCGPLPDDASPEGLAAWDR